MQPEYSLGHSAMMLGAASVVTQVCGFIYRIFLARMVSAEVLGIFQLIMPVYSVALSLTVSGLTVAVSQQSATLQAGGQQGLIRRLLHVSLLAFLALIGMFSAVIFLWYDPISVGILGDARTQAGLLLLMPCLALTGVENLHKHYFFGTGHVVPAALIELLEMLVRAVAVLSLLAFFLPQSEEYSVALIVCGMIACELVSALALVLLAKKDLHRRRFFGGQGGRLAMLRSVAAVAAPVGVSATAATLMGAANAVLIPRRLVFGGAEVSRAMSDYGIISAMTMPLLGLPTALIGALNLVLLPRLSESLVRRDCSGLQRRLHRSLKLVAVTMMPAMTFVYLLGDEIGLLLFRQSEVGRYLAPMAVGTFFACLSSVLGAALNGLGQQKYAARISILCGAVQLGFTYFFVGLAGVGLWGYAAGFCASNLLCVWLAYRPVKKLCNLKFDRFSWLIAPGLATLLSVLWVNLLHPVLVNAGVGAGLAVVASLGCGAVLYLVTMAAMGVKMFT